MPENVSSVRAARRMATGRRIVRAANELTIERGLDGWTMDDLAEQSAVARRTLFNYFATKLDAVLGAADLHLPVKELEVFRAGGPSGVLFRDCLVVAGAVIAREDFRVHDVGLRRQAMVTDPRLLVYAHERFEQLGSQGIEHIIARKGQEFDPVKADCSSGW